MRFEIPQLSDETPYPKAVRRAVAQKQQAIRHAFRDHNERIRPLLPPALQELQGIYMHDALWQGLTIDAEQKTLQINLLSGDAQDGYFDLCLNYRDITLSPTEISLLCLLAHEESSELYWDEIDWEGAEGFPPFVHRVLWNTGIYTGREPLDEGMYSLALLRPEIELRFSDFALQKTPRPDRVMSRPDDFITIIRPSSKASDDALVQAILSESPQ